MEWWQIVLAAVGALVFVAAAVTIMIGLPMLLVVWIDRIDRRR